MKNSTPVSVDKEESLDSIERKQTFKDCLDILDFGIHEMIFFIRKFYQKNSTSFKDDEISDLQNLVASKNKIYDFNLVLRVYKIYIYFFNKQVIPSSKEEYEVGLIKNDFFVSTINQKDLNSLFHYVLNYNGKLDDIVNMELNTYIDMLEIRNKYIFKIR